MIEMVRGRRAELNCEATCGGANELLGVKARDKAITQADREDLTTLVNAERSAVAKAVDKSR
jgi:hypothetical protein